jgi:hypothetical protein
MPTPIHIGVNLHRIAISRLHSKINRENFQAEIGRATQMIGARCQCFLLVFLDMLLPDLLEEMGERLPLLLLVWSCHHRALLATLSLAVRLASIQDDAKAAEITRIVATAISVLGRASLRV